MRFSIRSLMIVIGAIGLLMGLILQHPPSRMLMIGLAIMIAQHGIILAPVAYLVMGFRREPRLPVRYRLAIEFAILFSLLAISSVIWTPGFYSSERARCEELARRASTAVANGSENSTALNREADWFVRKASELRWRGLWFGLMRGPRAEGEGWFLKHDDEYQLGVIESMDKREKSLDRLISPRLQIPAPDEP